MKMDTMNISLPKRLADYVRQNVERDYGNVSEFFRDLVRERIRKEIAADVRLLHESGPAGPGPSEGEIGHIVALQKKLRKERHARRVR